MIHMRKKADRELEVERYRTLLRETTDLIAVRLLSEIISEMESALVVEAPDGDGQLQSYLPPESR
jgi:hypothetical protein